jgi:hypothetical protein
MLENIRTACAGIPAAAASLTDAAEQEPFGGATLEAAAEPTVIRATLEAAAADGTVSRATLVTAVITAELAAPTGGVTAAAVFAEMAHDLRMLRHRHP